MEEGIQQLKYQLKMKAKNQLKMKARNLSRQE